MRTALYDSTSVEHDDFIAVPNRGQPMRYDDPLVQKHCQKEIEGAWKFVEENFGIKMNWDLYVMQVMPRSLIDFTTSYSVFASSADVASSRMQIVGSCVSP